MAQKCNNCGEVITMQPDPRRKGRRVWMSGTIGKRVPDCEARPDWVGHIPESAYKIVGQSGRRR